jgi:hypothetical protein
MSRRSRRDQSRARASRAGRAGADERGPRGPGAGRPPAREGEPRGSGAAGRGAPGRDAAERRPLEPTHPPARGSLSRLGVQLVLLAVVFSVAVLVAELAGAANLGVAFGVGQLVFAVVLVYLLLRR